MNVAGAPVIAVADIGASVGRSNTSRRGGARQPIYLSVRRIAVPTGRDAVEEETAGWVNWFSDERSRVLPRRKFSLCNRSYAACGMTHRGSPDNNFCELKPVSGLFIL